MADPKVDLILHPVRMRILMAITGRQMTASQLAKTLPDVAQATLYRHINKLVDGGALLVIAEHQVRGATEKVYELVSERAMLSAEDVAGMDKNDHMRLFTAFVTTLLNDFLRYLDSSEPIDLAADGVGFHTMPLDLNDEELMALGKGLGELVQPYLQHKPRPDRRRRLFSTVLLPAVDDPDSEEL